MHTECVKLLIDVSDPTWNNSYALRISVANGRTLCVDMLYPISDPYAALHELQQEYPNEPGRWEGLEQRIAAQQHDKLSQVKADSRVMLHCVNGFQQSSKK